MSETPVVVGTQFFVEERFYAPTSSKGKELLLQKAGRWGKRAKKLKRSARQSKLDVWACCSQLARTIAHTTKTMTLDELRTSLTNRGHLVDKETFQKAMDRVRRALTQWGYPPTLHIVEIGV